ncbi:MAG TPA: universal stress protein [Streptosporangiaceae bacterium]|nr:universal stress protein [Streptosporangiaceae bacterium]
MSEMAAQLAEVNPVAEPEALADVPVRRVIVGVDDSGPGLAALAVATELARRRDAQLIAVRSWALGLPRHGGRRMRYLSHPHVVLRFSGTEQRAAAKVLVRRAFRRAFGRMPAEVPVEIKTPCSDPALALVGLARRPGDVLVVGRESGHPVRRLIHGSVSQYCVRHARCPVLLVPESGRAREVGRA